MIKLVKLTQLDEMLSNYSLIKLLSPSLTKSTYKKYLLEMIPHNYFQVIGVQDDITIAVSGYWIATKIYSGRYLEIDNFIVREEYRSKGIGKKMIQWMEKEAQKQECKCIMLDAYVQNYQAHKFYYANGYKALGFHYTKRIK